MVLPDRALLRKVLLGFPFVFVREPVPIGNDVPLVLVLLLGWGVVSDGAL